MDGESYIKSLACILAEREERSNGINGMLAVLFLVRRRADQWYAGDWVKTITAHNQFSSMVIKGDPETVWYPDSREPNFQKILQYVDGIYDGSTLDNLTNGALYYSDLNSPAFQKGGWFDVNIVQKPDEHPRTAQVGTTTYFK